MLRAGAKTVWETACWRCRLAQALGRRQFRRAGSCRFDTNHHNYAHDVQACNGSIGQADAENAGAGAQQTINDSADW